MSTQSILRILAGSATVAVLTGALIGGIAGVAHATTISPERPTAADYRPAGGPPADNTIVLVMNERNGECLMTRSWTYAEQVVTRGCNGSAYQRWRLSPVGNGTYRLINGYNDMCLDVPYLNQDDWTPVVQAGCWGGANQHWRVADVGNGYYQLVAQHSFKCLDISWGAAIQYGCNNSTNQRFRFL